VNVQTLSVRKRHYVGFLVVLLGSALTLGCAQTRQTILSHLWGPDRITFKQATGKLVKTTGKLTALVRRDKSSQEDEGSRINNASNSGFDFDKTDRNSIRMAGLERPEIKKPVSRSQVVSRFVRRNPLQDELVEDPFLTEYSPTKHGRSGSETNSWSKENSRLQEVFKQTVKREVADAGRTHDELITDEPNPFAKFEKRSRGEAVKAKISTQTVTSQKPAGKSSQFVRDFDSELDRLRGKITKDDTDVSPSRNVVLLPDKPAVKSADVESPVANLFTLARKPDTATRDSVDKPMAKGFGTLKSQPKQIAVNKPIAKGFGNLKRRPKQIAVNKSVAMGSDALKGQPKRIAAEGISSRRRSFSTNYDKLRQRRASDMVELVPAPSKVEPTPGRMLPEYGGMILETDSVPSRSATRRLSRALRMTSGYRPVRKEVPAVRRVGFKERALQWDDSWKD